MNNPGEIKGFCHKSYNLRPSSELFFERHAITRVDLLYGTVLGAPWSDDITFFGLHLSLAERCYENLQSAKGLRNVNPAWAITWLVGVIRVVNGPTSSGSNPARIRKLI